MEPLDKAQHEQTLSTRTTPEEHATNQTVHQAAKNDIASVNNFTGEPRKVQSSDGIALTWTHPPGDRSATFSRHFPGVVMHFQQNKEPVNYLNVYVLIGGPYGCT